jgi:hypothetical protein
VSAAALARRSPVPRPALSAPRRADPGDTAPAGTPGLLITREWAILAGENDYTTGTFGQITGRPPRPVAEFLHQYRAEFL